MNIVSSVDIDGLVDKHHGIHGYSAEYALMDLQLFMD